MSAQKREMTEKDFGHRIWILKDKMYRYALAIIGNGQDAEDIIQDVFKKLWEERVQLSALDNTDAYVLRMVRNLCIDHIRKERAHESRLEALMVESDISYLEQEDLKDMGRLINKIIGKMPERYGTVLHLRDVEGYEMEEISQITGIDTATVRVILSRARKSVREKIIKLMVGRDLGSRFPEKTNVPGEIILKAEMLYSD